MPTVRKLSTDEVQAIQDRGKGLRQLIEEQYDRYIAEYEIGDYGEAQIDDNEKRLTVRNRFKAAAERRGVALRFIRTTGDSMRFKVVARNETKNRAKTKERSAANSSSDGSTAKRKPGRPKKS